MGVVSTGGVISSRWLTTREMRRALANLPSSQRRDVKALARKLDAATDIGYYAALDVVVRIGVEIINVEERIKLKNAARNNKN